MSFKEDFFTYLEEAVAAGKTVEESLSPLLGKLAAEIAAAVKDPVQLITIAETLAENAPTIVDAVKRGTAAAEEVATAHAAPAAVEPAPVAAIASGSAIAKSIAILAIAAFGLMAQGCTGTGTGNAVPLSTVAQDACAAQSLANALTADAQQLGQSKAVVAGSAASVLTGTLCVWGTATANGQTQAPPSIAVPVPVAPAS